MRKFLFGAFGIAVALVFAISGSQLKAQVEGEFESITIQQRIYQSIEDLIDNDKDKYAVVESQVISPDDFGLLPNYVPKDLNDGYALIDPMPFEFEFNGEVYSKVWVNVNGYITFGNQTESGLQTPPFLPTPDPTALFKDATNFPVNVIAPFWGDHYYRDEQAAFLGGFLETRISWAHTINTETGQESFIIEWKDLNINYKDENGKPIVSSVADFQVILHKATDQVTKQGDIEFSYGQVGGNPNTTDTRIITRGASVGIKGEGKIIGTEAEFLNGLVNINPANYTFPEDEEKYNLDLNAVMVAAAQRTTLSNEWRPSGGDARSIYFSALSRLNEKEWWGDGDVDLSKVSGNRHFGLPQSRFVTTNDVRLIMVSVATKKPLDPVRRRAAYHGDVNHNGRYYFNANEEKVKITWRNDVYTDSLPSEVSSARQILFEANEYDAALILGYLSGRIPELPWTIDSINVIGKVKPISVATSIELGSIQATNANIYRIPVYPNGNHDGAFSAKFDINADVLNVEAVKGDNFSVMAVNNENTIVISGFGTLSNEMPVAYIEFSTDAKELNATNVRFNEKDMNNISLVISSVKDNDINSIVTNSPNPFTESTNINFTIANEGAYKLVVYDMNSREIAEIYNGNLTPGFHNFTWNGTDKAGNKLGSGMYIFKLTGVDVSESGKIVINR